MSRKFYNKKEVPSYKKNSYVLFISKLNKKGVNSTMRSGGIPSLKPCSPSPAKATAIINCESMKYVHSGGCEGGVTIYKT